MAQLVPAPFTLKVDRTIQDLIADGYVGEILAIDLHASTPAFIDRAAPLAWRSDFGLSGYNTMTMGIWYETLMRWVGEATRLTAMSKVFVKQRRNPSTGHLASIRVPDHVDIIADMACGAQATLRFSAVTGLPSSTGSVLIHGSEGTLHFDRPSGNSVRAGAATRLWPRLRLRRRKPANGRSKWISSIQSVSGSRCG